MSDLFVKLMRYCKHFEEDFFTECAAATLKADIELVRGFLKYICGNEIDGVSISTSNVHVETQKAFPHADIDLVFYLDRGKSIGVENKLSYENRDSAYFLGAFCDVRKMSTDAGFREGIKILTWGLVCYIAI